MQEMQVQSLRWKDPLEKEMAMSSSILAWKNLMERGTWWATVCGATEESDMKRWQEYTEELYKKDLHDPDNHNGVITHVQPDIPEWKVKWALESITMNKASGGDVIPV